MAGEGQKRGKGGLSVAKGCVPKPRGWKTAGGDQLLKKKKRGTKTEKKEGSWDLAFSYKGDPAKEKGRGKKKESIKGKK